MEAKTDTELFCDFMEFIRREADQNYGKARYYLPDKDKRKLGKFVCYFDSEMYSAKWIEWNDLMPVVEKIESLGFKFTIHNDSALIERTHNRQFKQGQTISALEESKIKATYKAVVEFIKWYTSQKGN